ncbi:acid phosphatase [Alkalispirochaeta sphaeroplastigenens]|uniref:Acid phosphatase n=1 Tax=Alkalispirochaeta sphaeroplastigenens TaxID=1187066 RepID=A0A2S4K110_9SPIO|nr:acid phosphatase [Alkalispirochaeta sphaeroplastigenens]
MHYLYDLVSSRIFLAGFFSWFLAQFLKMVIDYGRGKTRGSRDMVAVFIWKTGGMPSSHSALVTGLATAIGFSQGAHSPLFVFALFYGGLTIRDALGVRRSSGLQAQALNRLGRQVSEKLDVPFSPVKEVSGHTLSEVCVGALLGFVIATGFVLL